MVGNISVHSHGVRGISSTIGHAATATVVVASHWDDDCDGYINKYSTKVHTTTHHIRAYYTNKHRNTKANPLKTKLFLLHGSNRDEQALLQHRRQRSPLISSPPSPSPAER